MVLINHHAIFINKNMSKIDTLKILESIKGKILFEPIDDRVLIKPLKQHTIKRTIKVPKKVEATADAAESTETEMVDEVRETPTNCQLGVVLKSGVKDNAAFEPGDIIVYPTNAGMPMELFKDSRLLKRYEILGLWAN